MRQCAFPDQIMTYKSKYFLSFAVWLNFVSIEGRTLLFSGSSFKKLIVNNVSEINKKNQNSGRISTAQTLVFINSLNE